MGDNVTTFEIIEIFEIFLGDLKDYNLHGEVANFSHDFFFLGCMKGLLIAWMRTKRFGVFANKVVHALVDLNGGENFRVQPRFTR